MSTILLISELLGNYVCPLCSYECAFICLGTTVNQYKIEGHKKVLFLHESGIHTMSKYLFIYILTNHPITCQKTLIRRQKCTYGSFKNAIINDLFCCLGMRTCWINRTLRQNHYLWWLQLLPEDHRR